MRISIFGLGYVGAVSCACFAKMGHSVIGLDVNPTKLDMIASGRSPIVEVGLDELIADAVRAKKISPTADVSKAIHSTDLSIICVGTPSQPNGDINLEYIFRVCDELAYAIAEKKSFHSIVIRSTVVPGTIAKFISRIEELTSLQHGTDFGVASNPEFLREGSAIKDFWDPPYTVIGTECERTLEALRCLYASIEAKVYPLRPEEAEMIKYANNSFHAVKISFANEIGNICKALGVDGQRVMEVVAEDRKLNLSPYYLRPGFAFGGSCLPKDVRGLNYQAKTLDVQTPLLASLLPSNEFQVANGMRLIQQTGKKSIGFLGFAFKGGTDDLRESPVVEVVEFLLGKGYDLALYDSNVLLSRLTGKNREFLSEHIPHINSLLCDSVNEVVERSDVVVIGNYSEEFKSIMASLPPEKIIIDLVRVDREKISEGNYVGICW